MDLLEETLLGESVYTHWYYVSKARALMDSIRHIPADRVLDVGAGSGVFSKKLIEAGIAKAATCIDPNYETERTENYKGTDVHFVKSVPQVTQNLVLIMDVLEHVDDDVALLREYVQKMPSGGHILITVPAFRFLWSGHDVFLGHRRRYTAAELLKTVNAAGLTPVRTRYFFGLLFPLIALVRLTRKLLFNAGTLGAKSDMKPCPEPLNSALILAHDVERLLVFPLNLLAGLSVFCLARKP